MGKNFVLATHLVLDLALLAEALGADVLANFTSPEVGTWHKDSMFLLHTHFPACYTNDVILLSSAQVLTIL